MSLTRTTLLNGMATGTRLASALILNKLLAVYVGPAGFGMIGQFHSLMSLISAAAGGVFSSGVTKLTAQHAGAAEVQLAVWRTALTLGLVGAGVGSLSLLLFGPFLATQLLADATLSSAVFWLAAATGFLAVNTVLLAALSGLKKVEAFVAASIAGSFVSAGVATLLVLKFGLYGGLIAIPIGQALCGVVTALFFQKVLRCRWRDLVGRLNAQASRGLGGFAVMAATTAIVVPLSHIVIRDGLTRMAGADMAGVWQAMWKLSETHLLLLTTTLSLHFLPRFSEIMVGSELRREVAKAYLFVLPLVGATAICIYLLREPLILMLFSPAFLPLAQALGWQLLGDVLKIGSWVPAFTMISHARVRLYVATECGFSLLVAVACLVGFRHFGLPGAGAGYAATYALYWAMSQWQLVRLAGQLNAAPGATRIAN